MKNIRHESRVYACYSFNDHYERNTSTDKYFAPKQRHPNDCITACFRLLSDNPDKEAPPEGLSYSDALIVAPYFGLYLEPLQDLDWLKGRICVLLGLTTDPKNHAFLIYICRGEPTAIYDPAEGYIFIRDLLPTYEWTHLSVVYKPTASCF